LGKSAGNKYDLAEYLDNFGSNEVANSTACRPVVDSSSLNRFAVDRFAIDGIAVDEFAMDRYEIAHTKETWQVLDFLNRQKGHLYILWRQLARQYYLGRNSTHTWPATTADR